MSRIKINDITILYKEQEKEELEKLMVMVENNYDLVESVLPNKIISTYPTNREDIYTKERMEEELNQVIISNYWKDGLELLQDESTTFLVYKIFLWKQFHLKDDMTSSIEIKELINIMALKYCLEQENGLNQFLDFVKYQKEEEKNIILEWYTDKQRYKVYQILLEEQIEYFPDDQEELSKKFDFVFSIMPRLMKNYKKKERIKNRVTINQEQLIEIFKKYLDSIHAKEEWKITFEKLVEENRIIEGETSSCQEDHIEIDFNHTLDDLVKLSHEFAHFLSEKQKDYNESDLIEYPSIYHELNMKDFLISMGFLEEDAKNFYYHRIENEIDNYINFFSFFHDIYQLNKEGSITEKSLWEAKKERYKVLREKEEEKEKSEDELKRELDHQIDFKTLLILNNSKIVVESFQYIYCLLLSIITMKKKEKDDRICDIMNHITEKYGEYNSIDEIINMLDGEKQKEKRK